jgi:hypothetical protein
MQDRRIGMMKIWLLKAKDIVEYDSCDRFVVRAESSRKAREMASVYACDIRWKDREWASCELVRLEMRPAVILASFKAG